LPSPVGEGVSRQADGWGASLFEGGVTVGDGEVASPFGRGVLRKQDGEGFPLYGNSRRKAQGGI